MKENKYAVAIGVFDGLHIGHKTVIEQATALREEGLHPAVFTFSMTGALKRGGMLVSDEFKMKLLREMGIERIESPAFSTFAGMNGERFVTEKLIGEMNAAAICCGYDFRFGSGRACGTDELKEICEKHGVKLIVMPKVELDGEAVSSSRIRAALEEGDMEKVNRMLGWNFSFELEVVHGRKLARSLGFPTLNQRWPGENTVPRFGVYGSKAYVDGKSYSAVTNIGVKPTVAENGEEGVLAETHISGYSGDLYGKKVKVELLRFLRPEQKFDSIESLKKQMGSDVEQSGKLLKENCK